MIRASIATAAFLLFGASQSAMAQAAPAPELIAKCNNCHGGAGGNKAVAPILNGLSADYLVARMNAFSKSFSQSPHAIENMWPVIANMDPAAKRELAEYFANIAVPATRLNSASLGKDLYEQDVPAQGLASCQSCHGAEAQGQGAIPRLAGQRPEYLASQLWAFKLAVRIHGPMNTRAMKFSATEIDALANYLA